MSKSWKIFKASSERFRKAAQNQLEREGYEEWMGGLTLSEVPSWIWEQFLLENIAGRDEVVRLVGFKEVSS